MAENENLNVPAGQLREGGEPAVVNPAVSGDANLLNGDAALEAVPISSAQNTVQSPSVLHGSEAHSRQNTQFLM